LCNVSEGGTGICLSEKGSNITRETKDDLIEEKVYECMLKDTTQTYDCQLVRIQNQSDEIRYGFRVMSNPQALWSQVEPYLI